MQVVLFCHSLLSDWNHGKAHFLRGVVTELQARGHDVRVYEPADAWSARNLEADHGALPLQALKHAYPGLQVIRYDAACLDLDQALDGAELVLVHEWNETSLVAAIGEKRRRGRFTLLFHDTHHRSVSDPGAMSRYDLSAYDGVLAFGDAVRQVYVRAGWGRRAWTWHEAADVRVFRPRDRDRLDGDLVWVGNWGDEERTEELRTFLLEPVRRLGLRARVHGVRYPDAALASLREAGVDFGGWLANFEVPRTFARYRVTVHVPRRFYATVLPGVPTIRVFEALACGIPLVCSPWDDAEGLFRPGADFLVARDGEAMGRHLRAVLSDPELAAALARSGLERIHARHTCAHRVDELLAIHRGLQVEAAPRREVA
jgi:spore maturation protein CgeB